MKLLMFCVRDIVGDTFFPPFCAHNTGRALRMFTDEINSGREDNNLYKHPDDFELYEVGTFDDDTGAVENGVLHQVALGRDVKVR